MGLTGRRYEGEQDLPEDRKAVHEIVADRRWRGRPGRHLAAFLALLVVVAAAHRQRFRELLLPRARACYERNISLVRHVIECTGAGARWPSDWCSRGAMEETREVFLFSMLMVFAGVLWGLGEPYDRAKLSIMFGGDLGIRCLAFLFVLGYFFPGSVHSRVLGCVG